MMSRRPTFVFIFALLTPHRLLAVHNVPSDQVSNIATCSRVTLALRKRAHDQTGQKNNKQTKKKDCE